MKKMPTNFSSAFLRMLYFVRDLSERPASVALHRFQRNAQLIGHLHAAFAIHFAFDQANRLVWRQLEA